MIYTAVLVILGLLAGSIYAIWKAHEERKAEQASLDRRLRQRYEAAMGISGPRPAGSHSQPWREKRKSA